MHYLDDYLTAARSQTECEANVGQLRLAFKQIGVPLAEEKLEGPSTSISFLGTVLDSEQLEARLPDDKLSLVKETLVEWLHKLSATKGSSYHSSAISHLQPRWFHLAGLSCAE